MENITELVDKITSIPLECIVIKITAANLERDRRIWPTSDAMRPAATGRGGPETASSPYGPRRADSHRTDTSPTETHQVSGEPSPVKAARLESPVDPSRFESVRVRPQPSRVESAPAESGRIRSISRWRLTLSGGSLWTAITLGFILGKYQEKWRSQRRSSFFKKTKQNNFPPLSWIYLSFEKKRW